MRDRWLVSLQKDRKAHWPASATDHRALSHAHVPRSRLTEFITNPYQAAVTTIVAEAGAGKTTLALEWARQASSPVAWHAFDGDVGDLAAIVSELHDAVRSTFGADGEAPGFDPLVGRGALRGVVLSELRAVDRDITLVLDRCECVSSPENVTLLNDLIALSGDRLRLVLIGRALPPLKMGRIRALGQVREIGSDALRFTRDEAGTALRAMTPTGMPAETIDGIVVAAEGWVAGVVLCGMAAQRPTAEGNAGTTEVRARDSFLDEYILQEILAPLSQDARELVLATCDLPWLSAELCAAVLDRDDGADALADLTGRFPFLSEDDEHEGRYRYNELVREGASRISRAMVPERDRVERSRRAATWLVQAGDLSAAAELALAFPDTAWTAAMVEPQCRSLADRSDFDTLERWIERIPEPVLDSSLDLAYWRIAARFGLGRTYGADALVNELAPRMIASGSSLQSGRLSLCRGLVAFHAGNDTDAGAHLTAALGQLPEDALVERQHASTMAGQLLFRQGHDDEAATAFKQAEISAMHLPLDERWSWFVIAPGRANGYALRGDLFSAITKYRLILAEITPSPASVDIEGFLRCRLVSLHIERNDLDAAKREIERIDELLASDPRPWHRDAVVAKARFLFAHGRQADAETWASEHLTHLRRLPEKPQLVHLLARMWLERGEYPLVESWLADVDPFGYPWVQVFGDIGPRAMAITLDLVRQQYGEAAAAAETMMGEAVSGRHWSEVISLAAQWAVALHGLGQAERSQEVMRSAIERAVPGGFVRALHVPGFDTVAMFADVWAEDREFGQLRRALQDVQGHVEHGDTVSISKRELEVLRLVAEGRTNQQIAEAMYISTNTVRNHLVRISQRLETSNRQEAVARARQLGILY